MAKTAVRKVAAKAEHTRAERMRREEKKLIKRTIRDEKEITKLARQIQVAVMKREDALRDLGRFLLGEGYASAPTPKPAAVEHAPFEPAESTV